MPVVEREAPRHHWRRYVSAWLLIVGCGTPTACSDANTGGANEQTLPTHFETTTTAPNATPRASPSPATSSVPTPRYRGMIEEAIGGRQFWMPIMEAELGLHGALWALVASAPREAPGPRLTLLKFTPIGPRGSLALSGPPEHLMVLSQPAVDRQDAGRELARILSAPTPCAKPVLHITHPLCTGDPLGTRDLCSAVLIRTRRAEHGQLGSPFSRDSLQPTH